LNELNAFNDAAVLHIETRDYALCRHEFTHSFNKVTPAAPDFSG
jgi:hypothetical protein